MSYRERRNRRDEAAAASERFAEFMALAEEQAKVRVIRKRLLPELATGGCEFAAELRGLVPEVLITYLEEGGAPAWVRAGVAESLDEQEADLHERMAAYHGDAAVEALVEAAIAVGNL